MPQCRTDQARISCRERLAHFTGYPRDQFGIGRVEACSGFRAQLRCYLVINPTWPWGHQHDASCKEGCFVDRVSDEHHSAAKVLPKRQQVLLQPVASEFVECGKGLVHEQEART